MCVYIKTKLLFTLKCAGDDCSAGEGLQVCRWQSGSRCVSLESWKGMREGGGVGLHLVLLLHVGPSAAHEELLFKQKQTCNSIILIKKNGLTIIFAKWFYQKETKLWSLNDCDQNSGLMFSMFQQRQSETMSSPVTRWQCDALCTPEVRS